MAGRGGRPPFRGGRGGRRGGGRGGPGGPPVTKDDDGTVITAQLAGPPPLFPENTLPEIPELSAKDKLTLIRRRDLVSYWKGSPYFLELPKETQGADPLAVERYNDGQKKRQKKERLPLTAMLTLLPEYFPEELFSDKDKRAYAKARTGGKGEMWKSQGGNGLRRIDQLAQLESKLGEGKEGPEGGAPGGGQTGADDEDLAALQEEEEDDYENDDYYQGQHYDDDEGYDDVGDDGGDDAVYS